MSGDDDKDIVLFIFFLLGVASETAETIREMRNKYLVCESTDFSDLDLSRGHSTRSL